jgi:hypothetical protein
VGRWQQRADILRDRTRQRQEADQQLGALPLYFAVVAAELAFAMQVWLDGLDSQVLESVQLQ